MKRNGLVICGGILEIIAGGLWLIVTLTVNNLANTIGGSLKIEQFIIPLCLISLGIVVLTPKGKISTRITIGVLNFFIIGLQFYLGNYVGLGMFQIVLLLIASLLFFLAGNEKNIKK